MTDIKNNSQKNALNSQHWKTEDLFQALINTTQEAVIAIGEDGLVFIFNPAAENMFERKASEVIGRHLDILMPKDYRKKHRKYVKDYFSTGKPDGAINKIIELPGIRSDGEVFPLEISLSAGQSDLQKYVVAVARDISDKKLISAAIHSSEKRYRSLQETIPLGIFRSTQEGKILAVNPAVVSILGYKSRFEVLNLSLFDHFKDKKDQREIMNRLEKTGSVTNFEVQIQREDDSLLWASISIKAVKDFSVKTNYLDGILEDISERKLVERALIESEEKYRILAETAQDIIIVHDMEGIILYINQAGLKCLGYSKKQIEGKSILDFIAPDNHREFNERQKNRIAGDSGLILYNTDLVNSQGIHIPFEVSSSVFQEGSKPSIFLIYARDLSARKRLEYQLHQSQKMDSIGTLSWRNFP